ncbi:MAG: VWA domain-containing protein, partial [bacterium]|nr:VWA domain-containing protein [bacterium]
MPASFRYSRWDGTQQVDDLDAEEVLEALSDDFLSYGDLRAAMQRLYRWGDRDMPGLDELLKQVREKREQELGRFNLDSAVDSIKERLQDVVDTERRGIDRRVEEAPEESKRVVDRVAKQHR